MDQEQLRRELSGKREVPAGRKPRNRRQNRYPDRKPQPTALPLASEVAQDWFDRGNAAGFEFPFNVNYLALDIQPKIDKDQDFQRLLGLGPERHDQVRRWMLKMSERWWAEYVNGEVTQRNAKDYFLDTDWPDVKEYARTCLRGAYLKQHGVPVKPPEYPRQQEYRAELSSVGRSHRVAEILAEPSAPIVEVDEEARERLRSWRKRKTKETP